MHVDASNVPGSSILAIVATLASVALLSFSLRLYTHGRLQHSLGTDDWLLLVAALSTIGVLAITVVVVASKQTWQTNYDGQTVSILVWVLALVHVLGISFVKLSVALTVLRLAVRGWHRHTTLGCICLTTVLTVLWFGSALLFGGPITVHWSSTSDPEDIWELLGFINSVLDVIAGVFIVILPLPLLSILRPDLSIRLVLFVVYAAATAAVAAATIRTYYLYTSWLNSVIDDSAAHTTLWSSIELTLGLLAASASTLQPLLASTGEHIRDHRNKTHNTKHFSASSVSTPRPYPSESYTSTSTVIHRPNAPRLLSLRYHDDESNLDFDIETPQRTRTHTLRTRGAHSRNVSDWSQFSGFTYYTTTAASVHEASPRRSRVVSVGEMEMRTRNIGVGSAGDRDGNGNIGIAVTTLSDRPVRDEEGGEEMAELKRLFADKSKDWGWGIERSGRTSVRTSVTTEGRRSSWYKHGYMGDGR